MAQTPNRIVLHLDLDADATEAIRAIVRQEIDAYVAADQQTLPAPVDF